ncbi:hypothetical protein BKA82DRAFT_4016076 [Pisolithus tinctorius]|nr:hypothetical protein BKA82DRAFT_4016076 [Pisolithus tinctorius]
MTRLLRQFVGPWIGRGLVDNNKVKEFEAVIKVYSGVYVFAGEWRPTPRWDKTLITSAVHSETFLVPYADDWKIPQTAEPALRLEIDELNKEIARCEWGSGR